VGLDPSQVVDRRQEGQLYTTIYPAVQNTIKALFGFNRGGTVNTTENVGVPGEQPHLMLDEPAVLTGMNSGRPYAVAAEAGNREMVSKMPGGGLKFTPTSMPLGGGPQMPTPPQAPPDPVAEAETANDWQTVAMLTGTPLTTVLRNAASKRARPKIRR
jgi:hypothetical protein